VRLGIFYDHLVHFVFIWYIFPFLVSSTKKNLATLGTPHLTNQLRAEVNVFWFEFPLEKRVAPLDKVILGI
jgi:hypothetical protein